MPTTRTWHDLIAIFALAALAVLACPLMVSLSSETVEMRILVATPTPLPARVYILPFRQVFAVGAGQPITATPFLLYENGTDVFQMIDRQAPFVRLQTLDGTIHFWTAEENISLAPPQAAQADFSVRGKSARLKPGIGFACVRNDNAAPPLSACQNPHTLTTAILISHITSDAVEYYLADVNGKNYYISPDAIGEVK
jgi:hypothetical protein